MQNKIPLIDVHRQNAPLRAEILEAMTRIVDSSAFIMGPEVQAFEAEFQKHTAVNFAVSCASGTDALLVPLMAMDLRADDEVLLPSFTFYATAASVLRAGAKPVFVDSDDSYNLSFADLERKISKKTKAIIPVHLFGQMVPMAELLRLVRGVGHKIFILEDAAQSQGAAIANKQAGAWGDFGAFSFYPTKNLGAMGDAGMISVNSPELAERVKMIRVHGSKQRYYHECLGFNSRLDSLQAAVLRIKLRKLIGYEEGRARVAARYQQLFGESGLLQNEKVKLPVVYGGESRHVWNQFTIRVRGRDKIRQVLAEKGIGTEVYYPLPMHLQKCFADAGYKKGDLPQCELFAEEVLSLPMFPELTDAEICRVVEEVKLAH